MFLILKANKNSTPKKFYFKKEKHFKNVHLLDTLRLSFQSKLPM